MSTMDPVSHSGFDTAALAPNTAQPNDITPPRVGADALIYAIMFEQEHARSLLRELCDEDRNNCATLHSALRNEFYDFVPELICCATDKNKLVTAPDNSGMTALHWAAKMSLSRHAPESTFVDIFHRLVQSAKETSKYVFAQDHEGLTAIHHAVQRDRWPWLLNCLIDAAADKDAYLRVLTKKGETALHYAALEKSVHHVELLVERSNNSLNYVNMRCDRKLTALHQAARSDTPEIALYLLKNGANATMKDEDGNTAWDIACIREVERSGEREGRVESRKFLAALLIWENDNKLSKLTEKRERLVNEILKSTNDQSKLANEAKLDDEKRELNRIRLLTTNMDQIYAYLLKSAHILCGKKRPQNIDRRFSENNHLVETLAAILGQVRKEFHPNKEARRPYLRSREPSCIVQNPALPYRGLTYSFISLVMPCICVDKWAIIDQRKVDYNKETEDLKSRISNRRIFLEGYMPTTLDEYCNPSLSEKILNARNEDQVLGRYEKKRIVAISSRDDKKHHQALLYELWILARAHMRELGQFVVSKIIKRPKPQREPKEIVQPANVILVRQAWIWNIGTDVIMTQLSRDLPDYGKLSRGWPDPKQKIAAYLSQIVVHLDTPIRGAEGSLLRIYENVLVDISEEAKQYTRSARVEDIDIDKEKDIFHQISDLREELSMIKSVLTEQEEVWLEFLRLMWPSQEPDQQSGHPPSKNAESEVFRSERERGKSNSWWRGFWQARTKFDKYKRRMRKLEEDAERIEKSISTIMDLKQKHATMREAHSTALLSATVFGFTIITVVFAPLAFVTALFALPIDQFNEGKDGNNKDGAYSSWYIGKWSATAELVSIAVTLIAMWAGLRFAGLHVWGRGGLRDYIRQKANAFRTEEKNKGDNNRDGSSRDGSDRDEHDSDGNNRDEINMDDRNLETGKQHQTDGLGTRFQRILRKRHISDTRKRTNDPEQARL